MRRFLAWILTVTLLFSSFSFPAFADETELPAVEPEAEETVVVPTAAPTEAPTAAPTKAPTAAPTEAPTAAPTKAPTAAPTEAPTDAPTEAPTAAPTEAPTAAPTEAPTAAPTEAPAAEPTEAPAAEPTEAPAAEPTEAPAAEPTDAPVEVPSEDSTDASGLETTADPNTAVTVTPDTDSVSGLTDIPATTLAPDEQPSNETNAEPTDEPASLPFVQGYVRVKAGTVAYKAANKKEVAGTFHAASVVYAEVVKDENDFNSSWLKVMFDTEDAQRENTALPAAYVLGRDVKVIEEAERIQLYDLWNQDVTMRKYGSNLLPVVNFKVKVENAPDAEVEPSAEPTEEPEAEPSAEPTEEPEAEPSAEPTEEPEAEPSAEPTEKPEVEPSAEPTEEPEAEPSVEPTEEPEAEPSAEPTEEPEAEPSVEPTEEPEAEPSDESTVTSLDEDPEGSGIGLMPDVLGMTGNVPNVLLSASGIVSANITNHPVSVSAVAGEKVSFNVKATGDALTYQWQVKTSDAAEWKYTSLTGYNTNTLTITASVAHNGRQYRCSVTDSSGYTVTSNAATLTVLPEVKITNHPANVNAIAGEKITFTVEATGEELTYQWQAKANSTAEWKNTTLLGYNTDTLTILTSTAHNGRQYRCVVTDKGGNSVTSNAATLAVLPAVKIIQQPASVNAIAGEKVTFSVEATGEELIYRWQVMTDGTAEWKYTTLPGYDTDSLTFTASIMHSGRQYRCVVTDKGGNTVTSKAAMLTVLPAVKITNHPASVSAIAGEKVTFTVEATGEELTYQWQVKTDSTAEWKYTTLPGYNTDSLTITASITHTGRQYRCIVTDKGGNTVTSKPATLTVVPAVKILNHPANASAIAGEKISFTVEATGEELSYQWQAKANSTAEWKNTTLLGYNTDTLTILASTAHNGRKYRCVVTDKGSNSVTSNAAILTVLPAVKIISHPASVNAIAGEKITFTVEATGEELSYQWQAKANSTAEWKNTTLLGYNTDTLTILASTAHNGRKYRCVVTDKGSNSVTSNAAILTVLPQVKITKQPENVNAIAGQIITFTVEATGEDLTYQWKARTSSTAEWKNTTLVGYNTDTLTITTSTTQNGRQYCCIVTDKGGNTVTSNAATLTVLPAVKITKHPISITVVAGENAEFTVAATGEELTYQWQARTSDTAEWKNTSLVGYNTDTLTIQASTTHNGRQYRCVVTDMGGNSVTSNEATLTVVLPVKITQHPANATAISGEEISFRVEATGDELTYQWQAKTSDTAEWKNTTLVGYNTDTLTINTSSAHNGRQYRCIVTDQYGNTATSRAATLTVVVLPSTDFICTLLDGKITIIGYKGTATDITIPAKIGDYSVTGISNNAFSNTSVRNVGLSSKLTYIAYNAFAGLADIHFKAELDTYAYFWCEENGYPVNVDWKEAPQLTTEKSGNGVKLIWSVSEVAEQYVVYEVQSGKLNVITTVGSVTTYTIASVADGEHLYAVMPTKVVNGSTVNGSVSNYASYVDPDSSWKTITGVYAAVDGKNVTITWNAEQVAEGYRISEMVGSNKVSVGTAGAVTYYIISNAAVGTHTYVIEPFKTVNGTKIYGNAAQVTAAVAMIYVDSITLNQYYLELDVDETTTLTATVEPGTADNKNVTWSSDNSDVAEVSSTGVVTAKSSGTATITATANDGSGATASCVVFVKLEETPYLTVTHPTIGDVLNAGEIEMHNGPAHQTWTLNSNYPTNIQKVGDWFTLSDTSFGPGENTLVLYMTDGAPAGTKRTGKVKFYINASLFVTVNIYQDGGDPEPIVIDPTISVNHPILGDIFSAGTFEMYNGKAHQTWTVTSNCDWTISTSGNWFTVDNTSGSAGTSTIVLYITDSAPAGQTRTGSVTFRVNGTVYKTVNFKQVGADKELTITHPQLGNIIAESPIQMHNGAAHQTWTINSNAAWTLTKTGSWFTIDNNVNSGDVGSTTIVLRMTDGADPGETREGTLKFYFGSSLYATVKIFQDGGEDTEPADSISVVHPWIGDVIEAGSANLTNYPNQSMNWTVFANYNWSIDTTGTWFTVSPKTGSANTKTTVTITTNSYAPSGYNSGNIKFKRGSSTKASINLYQGEGYDASDYEDSFTVNHPVWGNILEQETIYMHNGASHQTWSVISNVSWSLTTSGDWFTVSPKSGSARSATDVVITMADGVAAGQHRDGYVKFTYTLNGVSKTKRVYIAQDGGPAEPTPETSLAATHLYLGNVFDASPIEMHNAIPAEQNWAITSNKAWTVQTTGNWFTVSPTSGSANTDSNPSTNFKITLTGYAPAGTRNNGTITFYVNGSKYKTVSIFQDGGAAVDPSMTIGSADFGDVLTLDTIPLENVQKTYNFTVKANRAWTASKTGDWFTITPVSGNAETQYTFKVQVNTLPASGQELTGSLTFKVNGSTFKTVALKIANTGSVVVNPTDTMLPAPTNLTATATGTTSAKLTWSGVTGASGFNVYRSTSVNGTYYKINSSLVTSPYTDSTLTAGVNYYYYVAAVSSSNVVGSGSIPVGPVSYNAACTMSAIANLTFAAAGETKTVTVTKHGSRDFTVSTKQYNSTGAVCDPSKVTSTNHTLANWLTVTKSGSTITLQAAKNYAASGKNAVITVNCSCGASHIITVNQLKGESAPASIQIKLEGSGGFTERSTAKTTDVKDHLSYKLAPGDTISVAATGGSNTRRMTVRITDSTGHDVLDQSKTNSGTDGITGTFSYKIPANGATGAYTITAYAANSTTAGDDSQFINVSAKILVAVSVEEPADYTFAHLSNSVWTTKEYKQSTYYANLISLDQSMSGSAANANGLIAVAKTQLGYHEGNTPVNGDYSALQGNSSGSNNFTEYLCAFHEKYMTTNLSEQAWCAYFVTWCARRAGISTSIIPKFSGCTPAVNSVLPNECNAIIYKPNMAGSWRPSKGDLIFFNGTGSGLSGHVGIVDKMSGDTVYYYDGNGARYSSDTNETNNHTEVDYRTVSWSHAKIYGFADIQWNGNAQSMYEPHRPLALYKYHVKGPDVKWVQNKLKELGYYSDTIDGDFGPQTDTAVQNFQRANGLTVDGEVGPNTLAALKSATSSQQPPTTDTTVITKESMKANLNASTILGTKKAACIQLAETLWDGGFPAQYIAGVLGNVYYESTPGHFENLNYSVERLLEVYNLTKISEGGKGHQNYIAHMLAYKKVGFEAYDNCGENHSEYMTKYSNKNIYDSGMSLNAVDQLLQSYQNGGWHAQFGLGLIQWTGGRTINLMTYYHAEAKTSDTITSAQCLDAERKFCCYELSGGWYSVFQTWNSNYYADADAAYKAGVMISQQYIRPGGTKYNVPVGSIMQTPTSVDKARGNTAANIYLAMQGK